MRIRRLITATSLALLASGGFMAAADSLWGGGAEPNDLTFSGPVALPGVVLPAGTYTFERPSWNSPDIVRVVSRDRKRPYFMGYTRRVDRPAGAADQFVTFGEAPAGAPPPITVWY